VFGSERSQEHCRRSRVGAGRLVAFEGVPKARNLMGDHLHHQREGAATPKESRFGLLIFKTAHYEFSAEWIDITGPCNSEGLSGRAISTATPGARTGGRPRLTTGTDCVGAML